MKCDFCKYKKNEMLQKEESGPGPFFEYCSKGHWEGSGLQDETLNWEYCPDFDNKNICIPFERDIVNAGIKIINYHGKRLYVNAHGYIHCQHNRDPLIKVITSFGNVSFICNQCGEVVKKELTPTSL
jgi:hypothetical protein